MARIYHHLVTYFAFPSAILSDKASGWLGCAAHNMRDITREPMRPSEELENKSEMTSELFGCVDSSTDKGTIDEEMVQVCILQDNLPVYKFVAVKALSKADAAGTVRAILSALETECECSDWKAKLVGLGADGAAVTAVNMGIRSGAAKRLQDDHVPHLVPVHCCAHK